MVVKAVSVKEHEKRRGDQGENPAIQDEVPIIQEDTGGRTQQHTAIRHRLDLKVLQTESRTTTFQRKAGRDPNTQDF